MENGLKNSGMLIDSHVHIYDCFDIDKFLTGAWNNFSAAIRLHGFEQSPDRVLMLAETSRDHWFRRIVESTQSESVPTAPIAESWRFKAVDGDDCAVIASGSHGETLVLIAGRQIVTAEGIEVLALGTTETIPDGTPLNDVEELLTAYDALLVLPWGVGKWLGRRGQLVMRFIKSSRRRANTFVGDICGRPSFWPRSQKFSSADTFGVRILPGTDPLPLKSETTRVGECGVFVFATVDMSAPTRELKKILRDREARISPYIRRERLLRFVRNQVSIRL
jgi:hypothetical protein